MNIDTELQDYEAAGSLAEELPYWGWLDDERSCLTRAGELMSLARVSPCVLDGQTPEKLDRVVDRWQRMLSGLDARTRFYFYLLRRPIRFPEVPPSGASKVVTLGQRKRREFLTKRVQDVTAYVAWAYDPGLSTVASERAGGPWWITYAKNWMARRRNAQRSVYLHSSIEAAAAAFRQAVDASRALVDDLTPLRLLKAHEASEVLSELTNRPETPWDGATGSGMNWRLAVSELEAERRNLRLDGEPVVLYSLLSPPGAARSNLLSDLYRLDATLTVTLEWRPQRLDSARRKIRGAQRHYFSKRYSMSAHVQETEGSAAAMVDTAAAAESDRLGDALVELETDGVAYGDLALTIAIHGPLEHSESLDGDIRRIFASHDAKVIREGYGQLPAWFSRMPGQPRRRQVRSVFVSAGVAACMAPIFGPPVGTPKSAHLRAAALAVLETQWRDPLPLRSISGRRRTYACVGCNRRGQKFLSQFPVGSSPPIRSPRPDSRSRRFLPLAHPILRRRIHGTVPRRNGVRRFPTTALLSTGRRADLPIPDGLDFSAASHRRMELERVRSERDPRPRRRPLRFRARGADPWNTGPLLALKNVARAWPLAR